MYLIYGISLKNKTLSTWIPTLEVVMNGTINSLTIKRMKEFVLQLKTICTTNLHNLVYVH